jgi:ketol-acid reductoisomerase
MGDRATQGAHNLEKWREATTKLPIEVTGAKMRRMMPWIAKNKLVDQAKN